MPCLYDNGSQNGRPECRRANLPSPTRWEEGQGVRANLKSPTDGAASRAVIRLLADYFGVPPSRIRLVSGASSRQKGFVIE
ncbi:MAG: hypothetical protein CFK49_11075 [Armatimonadetes bacterium JP3_11]|jgi:uncharacterized protein YggU (UPF0235/DUF167 family)|nr:MAG: hypothetical protein CFK48_07525 [Armatimonadetes bacterium CP1_7O]OYT71898.1 MAG: hypothetical protein CFK49_11075 [Armatimonadetes bacterium JP3_11]RMH07137.1 MAG: DUF167 domain-containing protein [Armatimonadota bacterium]